MSELRCLSVRQPWAWAISTGHKLVENRSRPTRYRGPLAIHASVGWSARGARDPRIRQLAELLGGEAAEVFQPAAVQHPAFGRVFPRGFVLAVVELEDCHPADFDCCWPWGETQYEEAGGRLRTGIHHLVLADVRPLTTPIPATGRLGLWKPDPDLVDEIRRSLEER